MLLKKVSVLYLFFFFIFLLPNARANTQNQLSFEQKLSDLDQLVAQIRANYGPLQYKQSRFNFLLDDLRAKYVEKIQQTKNNGEFYYTIVKFVAEFKDSHFGARLPTNHQAKLPFETDLIDGKVLIDEIDRSALPKEKFPFEKGDEVVSVDGVPITQVLENFYPFMGQGFDLTARRKAAMLVALRPGSLIPVPKEKMVKMTLQHGTSSITEEVELEWKYSGTPLDEYEDKNLHEENHFAITNLSLPIDTWEMERKFRCSGITRIAIPKDATMIMEKPFVAYYYPSAKGNLGYLRIPEYYPVNENTDEEEFELRYKQYQYAINMLEKNTVGLVIDQDHNCGGSVEYLEKMVGLFMDHPYAPQGFRFRASKRFFLDIEKWLKETDEHTLEHEELLIIQKDVKDAWERGDFLTTFTNFRGVTLLEPDHDVHYSKPILMLIDELSGSGGDAFPSLMQGYGRAKLFGTRTMGAGGNVTTEASLNYSGITLRMTRSLFYRPDGVEVENNGAVPNFNYTITRDDFVYQYLGYRAAYTQKLLEMLP